MRAVAEFFFGYIAGIAFVMCGLFLLQWWEENRP